MQWDGGPNASFCPEGSKPWLPIAKDYLTTNVAAESEDQTSMLTLHRRLLSLRCAEPALAVGSYAAVEGAGDILAYTREKDDQRFLVVLNLGDRPQTFDPSVPDLRGRVVLNTHLDREDEKVANALALRGAEGIMIKLSV
jgi:alpha-glucosidase